ncbi:exo-beta-N-acetylmuramidase NamZ family protein [Desulfococcus sp.]|uniref:exo-beta-N-acetylmuramidase NamZ family protein n=1 Tax=Desulfococcus sp. TaxID=2025834 RepID=UPI003D0E6E14
MLRTGLECFLECPPRWLAGARMGLLCNPASVDGKLRHARLLIDRRFPGNLKALYSPQHGFFAEKQDNMIESDHMIDPMLNIPVFSLYGETRIPTAGMLDPIDVLLIDLQDVGTRVYTFIYTMSYCMETAARLGKRVVVLDRPNPVGGMAVEGNILSPEYASFVGRYPIPMRHGLTIGETARLFNEHFGIGCDLTVIPMEGWERWMLYRDTGLPWVAPSPNLPTPESALVYPGQVVWEGTHVSEGRGTTQPFELFGAPYFDTERLFDVLGGAHPPGAVLRPCRFEPTASKWSGRVCRGFQIHVTEPTAYRPYDTTLRLLSAVLACHGDDFEWKPPPYEYEHERMPIDLILGDGRLRRRIEQQVPTADLSREWQADLTGYVGLSREVHLYT